MKTNFIALISAFAILVSCNTSSTQNTEEYVNGWWYISFVCSTDNEPDFYYECLIKVDDTSFTADCRVPSLLTLWGDWRDGSSTGNWITYGASGKETYELTIKNSILSGTWKQIPGYSGDCNGGLLTGYPK